MASQSLVKKLDKEFSKFIRKRDDLGDYFICCSCGQMKPLGQADAGHFINRRWMATRWREDNVHAQCRSCNRFDEGAGAGYTLFMIDKYGREHVEYLRLIKNETMKFSDFEVDLMLKEYKAKNKV